MASLARESGLGYVGRMNQIEPLGQLAVVRFEDADFTVLRKGAYVRCAVSGALIALEDLRYWNVDTQEAYRGHAEAIARWRELNPAVAPGLAVAE
jgi:hypothetical protein